MLPAGRCGGELPGCSGRSFRVLERVQGVDGVHGCHAGTAMVCGVWHEDPFELGSAEEGGWWASRSVEQELPVRGMQLLSGLVISSDHAVFPVKWQVWLHKGAAGLHLGVSCTARPAWNCCAEPDCASPCTEHLTATVTLPWWRTAGSVWLWYLRCSAALHAPRYLHLFVRH